MRCRVQTTERRPGWSTNFLGPTYQGYQFSLACTVAHEIGHWTAKRLPAQDKIAAGVTIVARLKL